ncbi:vWA domain-containing protein [Cryptosporangium arvum]|uniref:vWA domain-containing protein n=1 Tax=Cryptosporangium arvum TaxID=80871 RepID=UPI001B804FA7|nr:DUF5682 family protein [Cryptosporangium arvum]
MPFLIGVRHHSPALAAVVPALLDEAQPDVVLVELPAEFAPWLPWLADPQTVAPVALAGSDGADGTLAFYPFADFSPELAAIRWAAERGVPVVPCDLPLSDRAWTSRGAIEPDAEGLEGFGAEGPAGPGAGRTDAAGPGATGPGAGGGGPAAGGVAWPSMAEALRAGNTGRVDDDLWDRAVEARAPGSTPEAVRRAALLVGWALRTDALHDGGIDPVDLRREACMRQNVTDAVAAARANGHEGRVAAVIGAFHAPALTAQAPTHPTVPAGGTAAPTGAAGRTSAAAEATAALGGTTAPGGPATAGGTTASEGATATAGDTVAAATTATTGTAGTAGTAAAEDTAAGAGGATTAAGTTAAGGEAGALTGTTAPGSGSGRRAEIVTSLVPYTFALLDERSGYPAGIRDPQWQQSVLTAGGDADAIRDAAVAALVGITAQIRASGHPAGPGEAGEAVRLAAGLADLRGLPAPGRSELVEAVQSVLSQGELLGRGRVVAAAMEHVLVGDRRGRVAPAAPRSGLRTAVERDLAALRLPGAGEPTRDLRLDPLRSDLDRRREVTLRRLGVCRVSYASTTEVTGVGGGDGLTTRWQVGWTPSTEAALDVAGIHGVTLAQAAEGALRARRRRHVDAGGPTAGEAVELFVVAAECGLVRAAAQYLTALAAIAPATGTLPELLSALAALDRVRLGHVPGLPDAVRPQLGDLVAVAADIEAAAVRQLDGLAGSTDVADAHALAALAQRNDFGLRLVDALERLSADGAPLIAAAASATRVLLGVESPEWLGRRLASWVDGATDPDRRRALQGRLTGLLAASGPLLETGGAVFEGLFERVESLADQEFLVRLPALRGGFTVLSPAARDRLLTTVTDRLGDPRADIGDVADPRSLLHHLLADRSAREALIRLGLPLPTAATPGPATTGDTATTGNTATTNDTTTTNDTRPGRAPGELAIVDRWRLILGRPGVQNPQGRRYAAALDELYGAGRGEGAQDDADARAGRGASYPTAREWSDELAALFGPGVREEVLGRAVEAGRTDAALELDPASARPSVELLQTVLSLVGGVPEATLARLRPLVARLVAELTAQLATRIRPALTGLASPRPTYRPGGPLDLARTLRANLATTHRSPDGRVTLVPERPVFRTRARRSVDWRLVLVVDVSGSMEASVVWSALTASVLAGVPALTTHFVAFSTEVIDLSDRVDDPLGLLLEVRVGGGTHIAAGLRHARSLVTVPSRTLVAVVSDFEEGYGVGGLLAEVRALAESGCTLLGCASLDDAGKPRYSVPIAQRLVAAGMPVAALSPVELARWVGEHVR